MMTTMMIMMMMKNENDGNEKTDIEETLRLSELPFYQKIICWPPLSFCKSLLPSECFSYLLCVEFTVKAFSLERMSKPEYGRENEAKWGAIREREMDKI